MLDGLKVQVREAGLFGREHDGVHAQPAHVDPLLEVVHEALRFDHVDLVAVVIKEVLPVPFWLAVDVARAALADVRGAEVNFAHGGVRVNALRDLFHKAARELVGQVLADLEAHDHVELLGVPRCEVRVENRHARVVRALFGLDVDAFRFQRSARVDRVDVDAGPAPNVKDAQLGAHFVPPHGLAFLFGEFI